MDVLSRGREKFLQELLLLTIPDWVINPFLDVNSEETGVAEEKLVSIQNDIELRPKFKNSYKDIWSDVLYCLPNIIFSGTGLQCSRLASFQAKKQTENY